MRQTLQTFANSKNGAFIFSVVGIVILYGIQRITETNYQFSASTKDGETISLKPGVTPDVSPKENEESGEREGGVE